MTRSTCKETGDLSEEDLRIDKIRSSFILRNKFRKIAGKRRLGILWIAFDPIITSIIYLFVLTVLRSKAEPESLFIGITLYRILSNSLKSGCVSVTDFSGGIMAERVRTRSLIPPIIQYRIIDTVVSTIGAALILSLFFHVPSEGIVGFLLISQLVGFLFEGLGHNLAPLVKRIPDVNNIIGHILKFMFFAGPVLYPMSFASGLHYQFNECNPFAYFAEYCRFLAGLDSAFEDLNKGIFLSFVLVLTLLTWRGYHRIDKFRWEMSSWS